MINFCILGNAIILICITADIASPRLTARNGNYMYRYKRMLPPGDFSFPGHSYISDSFWDARGRPRKMESVPWLSDEPVKTRTKSNIKQTSRSPSVVFRDNLYFPDFNSPSSRNHPEEMTNSWSQGDGIEQRMMLPEGEEIPEKYYGPNYIWDTKGWPRLVKPTPTPVYNYAKNSVMNPFRDLPIFFQHNPSAPLNFRKTNIPVRNQQNDYQNNFIGKEIPNTWLKSDGTDPRILIPEGHNVPYEMFGPNYISDTKVWPRYVETPPGPKCVKTSRKIKSPVADKSGVFFGK